MKKNDLPKRNLKLKLNRETLCALEREELLREVAGGATIRFTCLRTCTC